MKAKSSFFILLLIFFISCTDNEDFIFLRNDGADMPILVKGNKSSNTFIIYLHGGPGNGTYIWEDFFSEIEKKYVMVYWNQRSAGESQGNSKPEKMTISQFVTDTEKLVALINKLYNKPKIFIMGHSWGGLLGTSYLISTNSQISGWIEVDGAHNKILSAEYSKQWVIDYANNQIKQGKDVEYWTEAIDWYANYKGKLTYTSRHYKEYLIKTNAYFYGEKHKYYTVSDFFFGRPNGLDLLKSGTYSDTNMEDEIVDTDLSPLMYKITIPSLLLWGRHDGAIPYQMALNAYNFLGTNPKDKTIQIFENSAHAPMIEENEAFSTAVITFIDKYR